jgi:hypothetical protein
MTRGSLLPSLLATLLVVVAPGFAAEDDEVVVGPIGTNRQDMVRNFGVADFDQIVFQNVGNATLGQQRLQEQINLQLVELQNVCQLTAEQKEKLELAARGDLRRFMEEVAVQRRSFNAKKNANDQEAMNNIWQDVQPLQMKLARGLTSAGSLLVKTVPKTLTPEQAERYEALLRERQLFRYRASIGIALHWMEEQVALTEEQRHSISELLLKMPPPRGVSQYDNYLIMFRLGSVPAEKMRSLLNEHQWGALKRQIDQYQGFKDAWISAGVISAEDVVEYVDAQKTEEAKP